MTTPSNANTSGLAPCPFCGGAPSIRQAMGETWVVCGSCSASTQSKGRETVAFDLWNRRDAPASPLPGGGWQDISTAPKDGTPMLAGSIHHSDREVVCWQDGLPSGSMDTDAEWEGWVNDGPQKDRFYANPRYFTHWQPLPAAPIGDA